jgi:uncharacterized protein YcnI
MKLFNSMVVTLAALLALPAIAHVTVWPRESTYGAYEKYVVRVPTEGKVNMITSLPCVASSPARSFRRKSESRTSP